MIPIFWRYAISGYLRIFSLSVGAFISILLVSRFKEIARFAALSSDVAKTALFALYQIPSILPMAIPLSAMIATYLFVQQFCESREMQALRTAGLSFKAILAPLLIASSFIALANFSITAELAPFCRRETQAIFYKDTTDNPLLLLQRRQLIRLNNAHLHMDLENGGKCARNFSFINFRKADDRMRLLTAQTLRADKEKLVCEGLAIVSHAGDSLVIENQKLTEIPAELLSSSVKKHRPKLDVQSLDFRMLRLRAHEKSKKSTRVEMFRRISLALSVISFTLLGSAYASNAGRAPSRRAPLYALLLTLLLLASYLFGKGLKFNLPLVAICIAMPHLIIWTTSIRRLQRISRGL